MNHAKLLDVLTSLPVSRSILPRAVYFATSRPANHAICSFIDSGGYASGPIRRCLFIDIYNKNNCPHPLTVLSGSVHEASQFIPFHQLGTGDSGKSIKSLVTDVSQKGNFDEID